MLPALRRVAPWVLLAMPLVGRTAPDGELPPEPYGLENSYDQSCQSDQDCALIVVGDVCHVHASCTAQRHIAVNRNELSRYQQDVKAQRCDLGQRSDVVTGTYCQPATAARCVHGACAVKWKDGTLTLPERRFNMFGISVAEVRARASQAEQEAGQLSVAGKLEEAMAVRKRLLVSVMGTADLQQLDATIQKRLAGRTQLSPEEQQIIQLLTAAAQRGQAEVELARAFAAAEQDPRKLIDLARLDHLFRNSPSEYAARRRLIELVLRKRPELAKQGYQQPVPVTVVAKDERFGPLAAALERSLTQGWREPGIELVAARGARPGTALALQLEITPAPGLLSEYCGRAPGLGWIQVSAQPAGSAQSRFDRLAEFVPCLQSRGESGTLEQLVAQIRQQLWLALIPQRITLPLYGEAELGPAGTLRVKVADGGDALVYLDGRKSGPAQREIKVRAGERHLRVEDMQRGRFQQRITVEPGQTVEVTAALTPHPRLKTLSGALGRLCGLTLDDRGYCLGAGAPGEDAPVRGPLRAIEVGGYWTCALLENGDAACYRDLVLRDEPPRPPKIVPGPFHTLALADERACAIRQDGGLTCWNWGQALSDFKDTQRFTAVSVGTQRVCGLTAKGVAKCWLSAHGKHEAEPDLAGVRSLALSRDDQRCTVDVDGALACDHGFLWSTSQHTKTELPTGRFSSLSIVDNVACALRDDGKVLCFSRSGKTTESPDGDRFADATNFGYLDCGLTTGGGLRCWRRRG